MVIQIGKKVAGRSSHEKPIVITLSIRVVLLLTLPVRGYCMGSAKRLSRR